VGAPAADAVDGLSYGYPYPMYARLAAGRTGAIGRSLVPLERSSALRSRQSESSCGGGSVLATNRAASAVRSVRKLTRTIGCQLRVVGIAADQAPSIAKQSEAQRRVGSIRPPQTFFSHHETAALLALHDAFAISLIPLCVAELPSVDGTGGLDVMPR